MSLYRVRNISLKTFKELLSRYPSVVPEKLQELDTLRYDTIPTSVGDRGASAGITKDEVEKLVEWKLKHGTFRPKLLALVQSNSEEAIHDSTKDAAEALDGNSAASLLSTLKTLTPLKGIGPATASLLLSVLNPSGAPFFSDELFRWSCWDEPGSPGGWKRRIKYDTKEYVMLVKAVGALRKRLGEENVKATDIEKVAWVLGKQGVDLDAEDVGEAESAKQNTEVTISNGSAKKGDAGIVPDTTEKATSKGTKRKAAVDKKAPTEGIRKSARTKR